MVLVAKFASVAEPDCASLSYGGENYEIVTWRNVARGHIEAALFVVGENGNKSEVQSWTVRDDNAGARQVDCPRVLYGDQRFIIFWIEHDADEGAVSSAAVHRSVLDLSAISTGPVYDASGTVSIGDQCLYDVCQDESDSTTDIFLAAGLDAGGGVGTAIRTIRYSTPYASTDADWTVDQTQGHTFTILGCGAHVSDGDMVVHFEGAGDDEGELWTGRCDVGTGSNYAATQSNPNQGFIQSSTFSRVASVRSASDQWTLFAEFINLDDEAGTAETDFASNGPNTRVRSVVSVNVVGSTSSPVGSQYEQIHHNLNMLSRPWVYRTGFLAGNQVYCALGFSAIEPSQEMDQNFAFIAHADMTNRSGTTSLYELPLVPVSAMTDGSVDSRPGQWSPEQTAALGNENATIATGKRMNHVSHVMFKPDHNLGPLLKSRSFAYISVERVIAAPVPDGIYGTGIAALQHGVREFTFHHEDPWLTRRDGSEPNPPTDENIRATAPWSLGQSAGVQGLTLFNGGVMQSYEGTTLVEHGFLWAPEIFVNGTFTSGGLVQDVAYYYVANYAWVDSAGQLHRGPPSRPFEVTLTGAEDAVTLYIRTLSLSMRDNDFHYPRNNPVFIELWRTTVTGGEIDTDSATENYTLRRIFGSYLIGNTYTPPNTPQNDRTDWYITVNDALADTSLAQHELYSFQLDTTSLQWSPPPPIPSFGAELIARWQNRVWATPPNERVIRYSDEVLPLGTQTLAPEFLDTNTFRIDDIGRVTAMQAMDDQLIVFTEGGVYGLRGLPNDGTGTGSSLTKQVLAEGTGCIEPRSVVLGPPGVFFQSQKGYYLLNRELQLDYITAGAAVEDVIKAAGNVRAATLLEDRHQIRLTIDRAPVANVVQPTVLIYDYLHRQWSEIPLPNFAATSSTLNHCQSATAWRGRMGEVCHVVLQEAGLALERPSDSTVYSDDGASSTVSIPIDIQTEWIHLSGISGLKRVWEVHVQTQRVNAGAMAADVYYDVDGSFDETSPTDTVTWASPAPDVLRIRPSIQKCSSIMIRVYETSPAATENVRLVSMTLRLGMKKTLRKLPASQIGT